MLNSILIIYFWFNNFLQVSEPIINKKLVEALVQHAQKIAKQTLNKSKSGLNLADDVKVNFDFRIFFNLKNFILKFLKSRWPLNCGIFLFVKS